MQTTQRISHTIDYVDRNGETNSITITEAIRSLERRNRLAKVSEEKAKKGTLLEREYQKREEEIAALPDSQERSEQLAAIRVEYAYEIARIVNEVERETFLIGIDERQLTTTQKELLFSDLDSHFWQNVDFDKVKEIAKFFRRGA